MIRAFVAPVAGLLVAMAVAACGGEESSDVGASSANRFDQGFDREFFARRDPRDHIEPIYNPTFVTAEAAALEPDALVLGLVIDGEAKAYPTVVLRRREIVNDELAGTPLLVSW